MQSQRRPIVLLRQRLDCPVATDVAPNYNTLGVMLPYTPLHFLLLNQLREIYGQQRPIVLVMTSGNLSEEPIAYQDQDACTRLDCIVDGMLTHNRDIYMRCDDSIVRCIAVGEQILRRSRGYVPEPITLSFDLPIPLLACGAHLKNTFCLGKGKQAFISHHIGDLENMETLTSFREGIEHMKLLFDIHPEAIVYDLHPGYLTAQYAFDTNIYQKIGVQHHHAHIASVMAEHVLNGPVIGIAADGTGYGTDGALWGGEIMIADLANFERVAHLEYVPLPGGEQAIHQPWRMGAVYLAQAYGDKFLDLPLPFVRQLDCKKWHILSQMIAKKINSPQTSSLGRFFDAIAALLGVRTEVQYEGQAAIELEVEAMKWEGVVSEYPLDWFDQGREALDLKSLVRLVVQDIQSGAALPYIAKRFYLSIARILTLICLEQRQQTNLNQVVLSGGVFQNRLLLEQLVQNLQDHHFQVYTNQRVPPNDGGLSLGQLVIAAARLQENRYVER